MLPACRTDGEGFAIPTFDIVPRDVEGFMEELWEFQSTFHDCFARSEPRAHFFDYMVGQFSKLERKSIEPMALQVEGGTIRGMQRFISDVIWDEEQMVWNYHQLVADKMGDPEGILMFDESGFVKKGQDSVGVARQYCGLLGKVENCQVGVFAAYASRQGYALVDKRLFLPEAWFLDAYAARRARCNVPPELTLQSKPQLAATMLQAIVHEGLLPCKYVVADCLYGNSPDFLDAVDACVGVTTFVAIPSETRCWLQRPRTEDKTYTYKLRIDTLCHESFVSQKVVGFSHLTFRKQNMPQTVQNKDQFGLHWQTLRVKGGTMSTLQGSLHSPIKDKYVK